jgi:hypothetical protein
VTSVFRKGYFELANSFAHRMMAKGKENPIAQRTFSNKIQSLVSCSGRKLILIIFSPYFRLVFFNGQALPFWGPFYWMRLSDQDKVEIKKGISQEESRS